jgi:hypothetical protein
VPVPVPVPPPTTAVDEVAAGTKEEKVETADSWTTDEVTGGGTDAKDEEKTGDEKMVKLDCTVVGGAWALGTRVHRRPPTVVMAPASEAMHVG